jgi:hypothetical protein
MFIAKPSKKESSSSVRGASNSSIAARIFMPMRRHNSYLGADGHDSRAHHDRHPDLELKFHSSLVRNVIELPLDRAIRRTLINTPRRIRQILSVKIHTDSIARHIAHGQI